MNFDMYCLQNMSDEEGEDIAKAMKNPYR